MSVKLIYLRSKEIKRGCGHSLTVKWTKERVVTSEAKERVLKNSKSSLIYLRGNNKDKEEMRNQEKNKVFEKVRGDGM